MRLRHFHSLFGSFAENPDYICQSYKKQHRMPGLTNQCPSDPRKDVRSLIEIKNTRYKEMEKPRQGSGERGKIKANTVIT